MASVVIVDDAELFREALHAAFSQEGFDVKGVAADAMKAIDMAREHKPDLVMLDLLMPGMSGLEVVGAILKASRETKVVLLTSSESAKDMLAAVKAGASGYLTKDTPLPRLVAVQSTGCAPIVRASTSAETYSPLSVITTLKSTCARKSSS